MRDGRTFTRDQQQPHLPAIAVSLPWCGLLLLPAVTLATAHADLDGAPPRKLVHVAAGRTG